MSHLTPRGEQSTSSEIATLTNINDAVVDKAVLLDDVANNSGIFNNSLYRSTASASVTNTTNETSIIASGVGGTIMPANFFIPGRTLFIQAFGHFANTGGAVSGTFKVKLGSTTIIDTTVNTILGLSGTRGWRFMAVVTCRTDGGSGTFMSQGFLRYNYTSSAVSGQDGPNTTTATINTTVANSLDITYKWATANASNTLTCTNVIVTMV